MWKELVEEFGLSLGDGKGSRAFLLDPDGDIPDDGLPRIGDNLGGYRVGDRLGLTTTVGGIVYSLAIPCRSLNIVHPGKHSGRLKVVASYSTSDAEDQETDSEVGEPDSETPGTPGPDKILRNIDLGAESITHVVPESVAVTSKWYSSNTDLKAGQRVHQFISIGSIRQPVTATDFGALVDLFRSHAGKVNNAAWLNGKFPKGTVLFIGLTATHYRSQKKQHRWEVELAFRTREVTGGNAGNDLNGADDGWNFIWNPELNGGKGGWDSLDPVIYEQADFDLLDALSTPAPEPPVLLDTGGTPSLPVGPPLTPP